MRPLTLTIDKGKDRLYMQATVLALITVFYNIAEGVVSIYFGLEDGTIALFGFGLDSFVEVLSGIGIFHMIRRLKRNGKADPDRFESLALKITGFSFFLLTAGLLLTTGLNLYRGGRPETTFWGIVIALISICTMWLLIRCKIKVGAKLNSQAIIADANCTRACLYLSVILLASSIGYEMSGIGGIDSAGAAGIAVLAFKEGREAFRKAKGLSCNCDKSLSSLP